MKLFVFSYNNEEPDGLCYVVNNKFYYEIYAYDEETIPYLELGEWRPAWTDKGYYL